MRRYKNKEFKIIAKNKYFKVVETPTDIGYRYEYITRSGGTAGLTTECKNRVTREEVQEQLKGMSKTCIII